MRVHALHPTEHGHDSENTCSYQTGTEIGNMFLGNKITAMLKVQKSSAVVYI